MYTFVFTCTLYLEYNAVLAIECLIVLPQQIWHAQNLITFAPC